MQKVDLSILNLFFPGIADHKWLIEILQQPILLIATFAFGYFLYIKYKRKVASNEFQLSDNQAKLVLIGGLAVIILIAHRFLGL